MNYIQNFSKQINFNDLTYSFKSKSSSPIDFISLKAPRRSYKNILDGYTTVGETEENQKQFILDLNETTRRNLKKSKNQLNSIENIKKLYKSREKVIKFFNGFVRISSQAKHESIVGEALNMLTPEKMFQILPIALAQVKADNNSENLLNEIRQTVSIKRN